MCITQKLDSTSSRLTCDNQRQARRTGKSSNDERRQTISFFLLIPLQNVNRVIIHHSWMAKSSRCRIVAHIPQPRMQPTSVIHYSLLSYSTFLHQRRAMHNTKPTTLSLVQTAKFIAAFLHTRSGSFLCLHAHVFLVTIQHHTTHKAIERRMQYNLLWKLLIIFN